MAAYKDEDKGVLDAILHGAGRGVSFGFSDELQGLAGMLGAKSAGDKRPWKEIYKEARDEARVEEAKRSEQHPGAYKTAEILSSVLTPVPGMGAAKAASAARSLKIAGVPAALATQGAIRGGISGLGESTADLTEGEVGGAAKDAVTSGILSSVLSSAPYAVPSVIRGAQKVAPAIGKEISRRSVINPLSLLAGGGALASTHDPVMSLLAAGAAPILAPVAKEVVKKTVVPAAKAAEKFAVKVAAPVARKVVETGYVPNIAGALAQKSAAGTTDEQVLKAHQDKLDTEAAMNLIPSGDYKEPEVEQKDPLDWIPSAK